MNNNTIPAVEKCLTIMELLTGTAEPLSQAEIATAVEASPSTCYRILQTLTGHGWLVKNNAGGYQPTAGFYTMAGSGKNRFPAPEVFQPVLTRLAAETGLCSKLSIRQFEEQLSILRAESPNPFSVSGRVGGRFPVIEGTVGAALLCAESESELLRLIQRCREPIEECFEKTLLPARVAAVRRHGFVLNEKPNRWHIHAMSAPVCGRDGTPVAAITLLGTGEDFRPEVLPAEITALKQAVKDAEERIG